MHTLLPAEPGLTWYGIRKTADEDLTGYTLKVHHNADGPHWTVEAR